MRLLRTITNQGICPAILDAAGVRRDVSPIVADIRVENIPALSKALRVTRLEGLAALPADAPLAPCVAGTGKIIAIGKNYPEHVKETGAAPPREPVIFLKATSSISGAYDPIIIPKGAEKLDWEVELAVIIGEGGSTIDEAKAMAHVAGYCVADDVSERAFQIERAGQWTKGKSADSFCPLGPMLVTKDEVRDPQAMKLWTEVNGKRMQDGITADMTFKIPFLIHYVSQFMSLQPGDVLLTGTPAGVGKGMNPPVYLKEGDVVRLGVEGLGEQEHRVVNCEQKNKLHSSPFTYSTFR